MDRPSRPRRLLRAGALLAVVALAVVRFGNDAARLVESDAPSVSRGTPGAGSLANGKRLPTTGPNFAAYSWLGALAGRNAVHHEVRDIVLAAYASLEEIHAEHVFVYGETGWPGGGPFWPHKTHQNGLSVDFMVPVRSEGAPVRFPSWPWSRWGYDLHFDEAGGGHGLAIDFPAIAAHLAALDAASRERGARIELVIFAPELQERLFATEAGARLRKLPWSTKPAWVRHDEHYHVNFRPSGGA